ncbi:hypothetical protein OK18_03220 [Chryseobacterium gallinarum]|uniref:Lipocalin-like domain-containing protein n=1 Tax=Chryseobacterium gallinarum TaxID=1324352 RepID=A0A0G3LZG4_CHRGL|nr:hypothetical protein [Chryseobacterium gallinarum]AKK71780.1 hypothetical protein OK18_03220 [Chryseobacterium gallinarum]MCL8535399.1 hypothetical protein [Chryseobacterium gallinarum]
MKKISYLLIPVICLSFMKQTNDQFLGNWKVDDIINLSDKSEFKELALHQLVKEKIREENIHIVVRPDSIIMYKKGIATEKAKLFFTPTAKKDSVFIRFDNHTGSITLKGKDHGVLTLENKTQFFLQKDK